MLTALALLAAAATTPCKIEHLVLAIPSTYTCEHRRGLDLSTVLIYLKGSLGEAYLGVYVGGPPDLVPPKKGVSTERATLGGKPVMWQRWLQQTEGQPDRYRAQILVEAPFGTEPAGYRFLHLFVSAATPALRLQLERVALTIQPTSQPSKP